MKNKMVNNMQLGIIISVLILIAGIVLVVHSVNPEVFGKVVEPISNKGASEKATVTLENFPEYLKINPIIKNLPKDALLIISVDDNGKVHKYFIKGKTISYIGEKNEKSDVEISFPSEYISKLNEADLCEVAREMNSNGDLSFKINANKISLSWKYKDLLKYKSCLGY
jgi:hypothetical protein